MDNLTNIANYTVDLVKQAGEIVKKYRKQKDLKHKSKGGTDFATEADIAVENFLKENLLKKFPESNFLMEESAPETFENFKSLNNLWVIDPIDGTANFSRGNSYFAISIALVNSSKIRLGIVYSPVTGNLFLAQEDKPDAILNGATANVSSVSSLNKAHIVTGFPWNLKKRKTIIKWMDRITDYARQIKINGSGASDICFVASGEIDGFLIAGTKPWDVAAGALILEKAGGKITKPDGTEWSLFEPDILATNGLVHQQILDLINQD